jgi:hypothetical protein
MDVDVSRPIGATIVAPSSLLSSFSLPQRLPRLRQIPLGTDLSEDGLGALQVHPIAQALAHFQMGHPQIVALPLLFCQINASPPSLPGSGRYDFSVARARR